MSVTRPGNVRVALVDDHPAILAGVAAEIDAAPDLELVATGRTLADAERLVVLPVDAADRPDVLVCDMQLAGDAEALRLLERLPPDGPAVLILSSFDQAPLVRAAFERGAAGYVVKSADTADIVDAIRTVAGGGTSFSAAMLRTIRSGPRRPSAREVEVLVLLCGGASNDETGSRLGVSERTVESHLRRMFDRYGVLSRTELAVLALREGWVADRASG